ncbi:MULTISPECIES: hypothetical protein [Burkholderia cepacia complex]|uniref:hypothetical protein n=1 Tax=Burkholderia cepacia complex TaxID=87882 RepID=UPI0023DDC398|nr:MULTISPECIES: hypothetical protein [Burkholderia cepacia complex]MDF3089930.1 hypothetical protein [Burkholderia semiarida]MDF3103453.1 hypothetical protein [Burkholderia semiarida]
MICFTCLKVFAFDQRFERTDAHDLICGIKRSPKRTDAAGQVFRKALEGKHRDAVKSMLDTLPAPFCSDGGDGELLQGRPVAVAKFDLSEGNEPQQRKLRALRQREASDVIEQLLAQIGYH